MSSSFQENLGFLHAGTAIDTSVLNDVRMEGALEPISEVPDGVNRSFFSEDR
jgi:hypothetical protein